MQKPILKNNKHIRKQAFTLIELLIVIAIIGILFIVLVSKVDFATDKAKATGVQTDFRSFQMAFDTVAKENAGFNTFGWDTGDANQNGKRDSYDEGDNGAGGGIAQNGIQDGAEVFTGHKVYAETFTKVFSLKKNGTGAYDRDALNRLETAINANLDPKLHITIKDNGEIVMANGAKDPWNKEYHGYYITNAGADPTNDNKDRGAIVMYSDGANNEFGSEHKIANGVVSISIPGSNKNGKDDYAVVSIYTYLNGYGEVKNVTTGFSNNQTITGGNNESCNNGNVTPDIPDTPEQDNSLQRNTEYKFRTDLTDHELAELYALSTSVVNDTMGVATFFSNENAELVIMYSNGLYGIGYRDYNTYYMYYTQEIFESGGSTVQGWVLMDTMEACETPVMYFYDDCIITSVNGLQDLKPFFDLHEDLIDCVCSQCGYTFHDIVDGTCIRCGSTDK